MADDKEMTAPVMGGNDSVTGHIISTTIGGKNGEPKRTVSYMAERVVGTGSFGIVFQAKYLETGETVAIKKVLQDRRYKNRELQLMRTMDHPNIVSLKHCFYSTTIKNELFLNLVMEYVPESMFNVIKHYSNMNQRMPLIYVKLYTYQIFRGLAYMHSIAGVCHRDLKPQNVLVDPVTQQVKICDFGSAKALVAGEANIAYICSRFYRAPELIFGATEYSTSIDIWSAGCVLAELLLGQPLFPGENAVDQLVEIIKVLGTPTKEEIRCMNPNYTDFRFPQIKAHPWHKLAALWLLGAIGRFDLLSISEEERSQETVYIQWPNSVCHGRPCQKIPIPQDFTIHGLWPDNYTANLLNCNVPRVSWPIQNVTLVQRLNTSWPDLFVSNTMSNQNFWSRQWYKHGSCSANLYQRDQYFEKALELRGRNDLLGILRRHGITPRPEYYNLVPLIKVNASIAGGITGGRVPILKCSNYNFLTEIMICFDPTGFVISCPQPRLPSCPNDVRFP